MAKSPLPLDNHLTALEQLNGWTYLQERHALAKRFIFEDFNTAFGFMTQSALVAEKMDHHPEWANIYNRVDVVLTTHDAKGVTEKDLKLARAMEHIAGKLGEKG